VKAVDRQYNTQPNDVGSMWNIRGCGCNAWHTVEVTLGALIRHGGSEHTATAYWHVV
jgi:hypothetical protein